MAVRAIDKKTVHKICSGQVVLSLAVAVKELVENALDAQATIIEVRLKEHGSELVEVIDNGCGVADSNLQSLTLKHYTSKIRDFSDLEEGVGTFGFRGEALSSLCALSNMTVTTRHSSSPVATRLEYDNTGMISTRTSCAREIGTTVSLRQLFHTLPVRHKEFHRNVKKEFNKMVQMLQGYCLVCMGVKITCYSLVGKSKRQQVLSIGCNPDIRSNILDIFGPKQLNQLMEIKMCSLSDLAKAGDLSSQISPEDLQLFQFSGFISRCSSGYGRSSGDRQYYFINSRPCDHSKLVRAVNEVYHTYNRQQYPCVVLNIATARDTVDVNVTPDKRQVMLHQEKTLLLLVKISLNSLFEPTQGQYDTKSPTSSQGVGVALPADACTSTPNFSKFTSLKRNIEDIGTNNGSNPEPVPKQAKLFDYGVHQAESQAFPQMSSSDEVSLTAAHLSTTADRGSENEGALDDKSVKSQPPHHGVEFGGEEGKVMGNGCHDESCGKDLLGSVMDGSSSNRPEVGSSKLKDIESGGETVVSPSPSLAGGDAGKISTCSYSYVSPATMASPVKPTSSSVQAPGMTQQTGGERGLRFVNSGQSLSTKKVPAKRKSHSVPAKTSAACSGAITADRVVPFDLELLRARLEHLRIKDGVTSCQRQGDGGEGEREGEGTSSRFRAKIEPQCNVAAEQELRKEIKKSDFLKMEVLGQFNLGFIITKLHNNLFIVDQHATDEKYNFERLQRETVIQHQKMLVPKPLELPAVSESIITDNLRVFEMNGFMFSIDMEASPMNRIKLTGKPVSKNWSMDKQDIEELVFMLSEGCAPGEVVRPSAVRAMFASRACRGSVMIGTALNKAEMRKLIDHMSDMDQPWNCPHGRPTMRHLVDMERLKADSADTCPGAYLTAP